jgi:hypothetical protein
MAFRRLPEEIAREILVDWLPPDDVELLNMTLATRSLYLKWKRVIASKATVLRVQAHCPDCRSNRWIVTKRASVDPNAVIRFRASACMAEHEDAYNFFHRALILQVYVECSSCPKFFTTYSESLCCFQSFYSFCENEVIDGPKFWPFVASVHLPPKYQRARYLNSIRFNTED